MNRLKLSNAGIDVNEGIKRFNGNRDMYERFLYEFPKDEHYQMMIDAIEDKDVKAAFQAAHALKGVAGNLSLKKLHEDMVPFVEELRQDKLDNAASYLETIGESYRNAIKALEE